MPVGLALQSLAEVCDLVVNERRFRFCFCFFLRSFSANPTRQLYVLWHDGHALAVDRTQVRVLKQSDQIRFRGFLKRGDRCALKSKFRVEVLRNLANQALERQFSDQQLRALLIAANLPQRYGTRTEAVGLLDASDTARFRDSLGLESFAFASDRLASGLLCSRHVWKIECEGVAKELKKNCVPLTLYFRETDESLYSTRSKRIPLNEMYAQKQHGTAYKSVVGSAFFAAGVEFLIFLALAVVWFVIFQYAIEPAFPTLFPVSNYYFITLFLAFVVSTSACLTTLYHNYVMVFRVFGKLCTAAVACVLRDPTSKDAVCELLRAAVQPASKKTHFSSLYLRPSVFTDAENPYLNTFNTALGDLNGFRLLQSVRIGVNFIRIVAFIWTFSVPWL